ELASWNVLLAPKGTPAGVLALLRRETMLAPPDPKVRELYTAQGVEASPTQDVKAFLAKERDDYGRVVRDLGITMEGTIEERSMKRFVAAMAFSLVAGNAAVQAQTYPSRQITLVVPFPPGGSTDVVGRIMAERMRPLLGQPVIIENVGGAGGSIAVGRVARAAPDGYTIDIGQWDTHVGSIIYPLNYDLQKDFEPIGLISVNPQLMVARKALPAN